MKIIMIYDQIQSGKGVKDDHMLPLGATKDIVGPAIMMEPFLKKIGGKIQACLYCGDGYFKENPVEVSRKLCAMINKLKPDVVICGPAFNYAGYAEMAAYITEAIERTTNIPAIAAMSAENTTVVQQYKDKVIIVKTPKKGETGLNESLKNICEIAKCKADKKSVELSTSMIF